MHYGGTDSHYTGCGCELVLQQRKGDQADDRCDLGVVREGEVGDRVSHAVGNWFCELQRNVSIGYEFVGVVMLGMLKTVGSRN